MSPEIQQRFRSLIAERLSVIAHELEDEDGNTDAIEPDVAIGRLSRLDAMQHQQIALAGKRRLEEERNRLLEAQRRIDVGTYGRCLLCDSDVEIERLKIQPDAVACVACLKKR